MAIGLALMKNQGDAPNPYRNKPPAPPNTCAKQLDTIRKLIFAHEQTRTKQAGSSRDRWKHFP